MKKTYITLYAWALKNGIAPSTATRQKAKGWIKTDKDGLIWSGTPYKERDRGVKSKRVVKEC